ncbi:MAG: leucine-rich repeat protein [Muribaculaceae bacterium]|nr:leucine-rich repeat protein [Muribaculaceae bacterium]
MKHLIKLSLLLLAFLIPATTTAHDFEVDGVYYNIVNDNEVEVTYQGTSYHSGHYSGDMSFPSIVTYNGITYSVTSIGDYAFSYSSRLTNVNIPTSVTSIGDHAFYNSGITSIFIPTSITSIGDGAFSCCGKRTNIIVADGNNIYDSRDNCNAIIETATNKLIVGCKNTVIPASVTSIGNYAFSSCKDLTSVNLPTSVATIGNYAYEYCNGLASVNIPTSVTSIGDCAFYSCSGLTNIYIPSSVFSIGDGAFSGCSKVDDIIVASGNPYYDSRDNCNAIIESATNTLLSGCKNTVIPNTVNSIGNNAFLLCGLTNIVIPNSVTQIGNCAFLGSGLKSITFGDSVIHIGDYAFSLCDGLYSITLPNTVKYIGCSAFYECMNLTSVTIPKSVNFIGDEAFHYCTGLTCINVESGNMTYDSRNNCNAIIETATNTLKVGCNNTIIPNTVTSIGDFAFAACSGLTSITIPDSLTSIGCEAFFDCSGLTTVTIPNSVTFFGDAAFATCGRWSDVYSYITDLSKVSIVGSNVFFLSENSTLHVPYGTTAAYQANGRFFSGNGSIVEMDPVPATSILLNRSSAVLTNGETMQLIATIMPVNADMSVSWAPSNPGVATVDDNGLVTAVNVGSATITAVTTDGSNLSASCAVTVRNLSASECFSVNDLTAFHGDTIVIPVAMVNEASIISFQTDIYLPEGLELLQEDGEYLIDPSPRMTTTHSIMSNAVSNGSIRVVCYSANYKPFKGESGEDLFYLTVKVADDAEGDYTVQLKNTLFTTSDFDEIAVPDAAAIVNVMSYIPGDANNSGTVTVTDVVVASQYILELNPEPFNFTAADVNEDGSITVTDVSRIAWMVLNPASKAPLLRAPALWNNGDLMSGNDLTLAAGETRRVSITLDNVLAYSAFQLDLHLPEGLTASNFALTDRAGSHAFDVNTLHSGAIRALCYSPALTAIRGHEGDLLTFDVTATGTVNGGITVDGIELVTPDCQTVILDGFVIGVNTVTSVSELSDGKTVARVEYFNLAGQQIDRPDSGVTLVVTTYTDGTRNTTKLIR